MSVHKRLVKLWKQLMDADHKGEQINLDIISHKKLMTDIVAQGSISIDNLGGWKWRGIKLNVVHEMVSPSVSSFNEIDENSTFTNKICLTIICRKPNGRIVYLDDPNMDEEYL